MATLAFSCVSVCVLCPRPLSSEKDSRSNKTVNSGKQEERKVSVTTLMFYSLQVKSRLRGLLSRSDLRRLTDTRGSVATRLAMRVGTVNQINIQHDKLSTRHSELVNYPTSSRLIKRVHHK